MPIYDSFEAGILTEGMTAEQKMQFHREMTEAWKDPDKAKRLRRWLGGIGAHHFYLGNQSRGVKYLLFCWTTVPVWMTLFEGDIKRRTAQVNSEIAQNIAARIRGGVPMQFPQPGTGFAQPGASPAYAQAMPAPPEPQFNPQHASAPAANPIGSQIIQPKSSTKRWALIAGGGVAAVLIVSATFAAFTSRAKESTISTTPVVATDNASAPIPVGTALDVQVYIAPDAESVVKGAGLTEVTIKDAVRQGLAQRRIVSIPDNAVIDGLEDWVSVRFSLDPKEGGSQLDIEFSVRNGASANNQLIRWQETNTIEALGNPTDIPTTLTRLMDNLKGDFNSPEYKKGQSAAALPEPPTPQGESQAEKAAAKGSGNYYGYGSYESCMSEGTSTLPSRLMEMTMCSNDEFQREDARLNREYKRVMANYKSQGREDNISSLRTAEIGWLKTMTSKCGHFEYDEPHGYKKAISENDCRLDMTKKRADELARLP